MEYLYMRARVIAVPEYRVSCPKCEETGFFHPTDFTVFNKEDKKKMLEVHLTSRLHKTGAGEGWNFT